MAKRAHRQQQRHLPMEIAEIILLKLPTKSLLRFQTLSKSYVAMIRDPSFSRTHLEMSRKNHSSSIFLVRPKGKGYNYCLAKFEDQKFRLEKEVTDSPVGSDFRFMCSCDDTVLFGRKMPSYNEYRLWNPINNTHRVVQSPFGESPWNYGLCHDQTEDDYKIVIIIGIKEIFTVHSCKHGTWTAIKRYGEHLSRKFYCIGSGVFIDRKLYWIGYTAATDIGIIYFDPACDSLSGLDRPEDDEFDVRSHNFLISLRGCVGFVGDSKAKDVIQFWMLLRGEGVSWEKAFCINKRSNHFTYLLDYTYRCYKVEDEIVIYFNDGNYIVYSTVEDKPVQYSRSTPPDLEAWEDPPQALVLSLHSFLTPAR